MQATEVSLEIRQNFELKITKHSEYFKLHLNLKISTKI